VPSKEVKVTPAQSIYEIWRGDPWPRNLVLLDNDFFGQTGWRDRISEIVAGEFKVSFTQGINVRVIDEEIAAAVAGVLRSRVPNPPDLYRLGQPQGRGTAISGPRSAGEGWRKARSNHGVHADWVLAGRNA
jgi:hypothetical protein